jgi:hypothetical protein
MPNMHLVCGLPASGKTHVVGQLIETYKSDRSKGAVYSVATDDFFSRDQDGLIHWIDPLDGKKRSWSQDPICSIVLTDAFRCTMNQIYNHVAEGHNIIIKDLFQTRLHRMIPMLFADWWADQQPYPIAYDIEIVYCRTPLDTCYHRNASRANGVPPEVLKLVEMQFLPPEEDEAPIVFADYGNLPDCQECIL